MDYIAKQAISSKVRGWSSLSQLKISSFIAAFLPGLCCFSILNSVQMSSVSDDIFGKEEKEDPEVKKKKMTALAAEKAKRVCS